MPLVDAAANLRRSAIVAAALSVVAIVALSIAGHPLMGIFACLGLVFGAGNTWLLQRSVAQFRDDPSIPARRFSARVFLRLGAITLIGGGIALLIHPDGLGFFAGVAIFQIVMVAGAAVPVFRSLRLPS